MSEYRDRLVKVAKILKRMKSEVKPVGRDGEMDVYFEKQRLQAKIEGIELALAYYDEMEKNNGL